MADRESWYQAVGGEQPLEQGDILFRVPILKFPDDFEWSLEKADEEFIETDIESYDVIVMTQSCDLVQSKDNLRYVTVCRILELTKHPDFPQKSNNDFDNLNKLRTGKIVLFHLLDICSIPGHERDFSIVEFNNIFSLPVDFVKRFSIRQGKRLRLKSPYKEHLSQAFARVFMRVGLPSDIPEFKKPK